MKVGCRSLEILYGLAEIPTPVQARIARDQVLLLGGDENKTIQTDDDISILLDAYARFILTVSHLS